MEADLYSYSDYKSYLNQRLDDPSHGGGRGSRARLSAACKCQSAYTAQVLRGSAHFSLEQGELINDFLGHSEEDGKYFLTLIQFARAGHPKLRARFQRDLEELRESRKDLKHRLKIQNKLKSESQATYYSSWHYSALHALVSIPKYSESLEQMAKALSLPKAKIQSALNFLVESGILDREDSGYKIGTARIHLSSDSPMISKHHMNWRLQAMKALEAGDTNNLHYSSIVSLSEADAELVRETLLKTIEKIKPIIRDSKEETLRAFSLDFFKV